MDKTREIGTIGKIIIPKNVQTIIDKLHNKVGATEWSGILFYKLSKGNISKMKNLEFKAEFIYPMNIGSHAYTEFDYNGEIMNAYDLNEQLIEFSTGMSHTHHNMKSFFSGTDTSELISNAKHYNYYLSIIFSFDGNYKCKIAFPSKTQVLYNSTIKGKSGEPINIKTVGEEDIILIGDLEVVNSTFKENKDWLDNRIDELKKPKYVSKPIVGFRQNQQSNLWEDYSDWDYGNYYSGYPKNLNNNFKSQSVKTFQSKKVDNIEDFLIRLITLESKNKYSSIKDAIYKTTQELDKNAETSYDEYEAAIESNVEVIYYNVFGEESNMRENLLKAALKLEELSEELDTNEVYNILTSNLLYAV